MSEEPWTWYECGACGRVHAYNARCDSHPAYKPCTVWLVWEGDQMRAQFVSEREARKYAAVVHKGSFDAVEIVKCALVPQEVTRP